MELPAAGEHVFAVESIEKKRSRKVCHKSAEGHLCTHALGKEADFSFSLLLPAEHMLFYYYYYCYSIFFS